MRGVQNNFIYYVHFVFDNIYTTNISVGVSFTQKNKTSCAKSKYKTFSSLNEAIIDCSKSIECSGVYDAMCDGGHWFLCPYGSTYVSTSGNSCTYMKEGNVSK